jgi:hypothetical protein
MLTRNTAPDLVETATTSQDAEYFEYTSSANPIGAKLISRVPFRNFSPSPHASCRSISPLSWVAPVLRPVLA